MVAAAVDATPPGRAATLMVTMSVFLLLALAADTNDWPAFRGEAGTGQAVATLNVDWSLPVDSLLTWQTPITGQGWSSPSVAGSQVWLTTATEDGTVLTGLCLDLATGETLWSRDLFTVAQPRPKHLFNSYASPTPAVSDTHAYLSWGSNGLAAIDRETFETAWVRRDLPTNHYRGPGSSPVLSPDESRLWMIYDGFDFQFVECLDIATGDTVWRTHRPRDFGTDNGDKKKAYGTPLLITADSPGGPREELICPTSLGCFALAPASGRELWRVRYEQFSTAGRPVYADGVLYLTTGFGKGQIHAVRPGGSGDVTDSHVIWTEARTMPSKPSPIATGGKVFAVSDRGVLIVLDARTGQRLHQVRLTGNYSASPLLVSNDDASVLFVVSEQGLLSRVDATTDPPAVLSTTELPDGVLATPVAVQNALLIRTRSSLLRID